VARYAYSIAGLYFAMEYAISKTAITTGAGASKQINNLAITSLLVILLLVLFEQVTEAQITGR